MNEPEVITSVNLSLFPLGGAETVVLAFQDLDGDGGNAPMMSQTGMLRANSSYRGQVSFGGPDGTIDGEIVTEGIDHQVFYQTDGGINVMVMYTDSDLLGQPIGLATTITTGDAGSGNLIVTLKHEPTKTGATVGNPGGAGGSTDAEVTYAIEIQ